MSSDDKNILDTFLVTQDTQYFERHVSKHFCAYK